MLNCTALVLELSLAGLSPCTNFSLVPLTGVFVPGTCRGLMLTGTPRTHVDLEAHQRVAALMLARDGLQYLS